MTAFVALALGSTDSGTSSNNNSGTSQPASSSPNWYEGGTLHDKTMGEWKKGSPDDKLATAGDWAAQMRENFKPNIAPGSMDALRPLAVELKTCVEEAYDDKLANQKASTIAIMCMTTMGWLK
jgi:hypothetical protein